MNRFVLQDQGISRFGIHLPSLLDICVRVKLAMQGDLGLYYVWLHYGC